MDAAHWEKLKDLFSQAIELPAAERASFLENCDEDLRNQIKNLIEAHEHAGEFIAEPAMVEIGLADAADANVGRLIDDYEITEEIGRGGMGAVYLAKHSGESFTQNVAVKLIKRGMDTAAVLKRFVTERQILANLEHPNIARLLDVGTTEGGLPYFVMEYIEGLPVTQFCDAHEFSTEERLQIFRRICSAVAYAHQNLVVHRDIKPSNILVTQDKTPKLLDFGIAKILNPDWSVETAEATATIGRLLTPEYASPEQLRGANITTASDVYSLGVVLYELLSGQRPFVIETESREEFIQAILTKEPVRPSAVSNFRFQIPDSESKVETSSNGEYLSTNKESTVNPKSKIQNLKSLKGDLDNIILKALRKEPARRYASVQEFSEDIRRHLAGLPVTAMADTNFYRFKKFITRHRVGVLAGSLVALTLLAATAVTSWQAVVAKRERDRAEQRFEQVRTLTRTILFDYYEQIVKLPGSTPLLEKMVKNTLEYLDKLVAESDGDVSLQSEIAAAYQKIGDVQGNPYQGNLGNIEGAIDSYRKSQTIREKMVSENPSNAEMRRSLAKSYESIGDMFWMQGEYAESEKNYRENLRIHTELINSEAGTIEDVYGIARASHRIGQALSRNGDLDDALINFQFGLEQFTKVTTQAPENKKYRRGRGSVILKIGDVQAAEGDWRAALENHRKGLEIWSELSAAEPQNAAYRRDTTIAADRIAMDLKELDALPEALKVCRRAVEIQQEISAADPQNVQFRSELGLYYVNLGNLQGKLRKFSEARENVQKGLKILQQFAEASPQWIDLRRDLALSYISAGEVFSGEGNDTEAADYFLRSAELLETAPLRKDLPEKLAQSYQNIGDVHQKARRFQEAKQWFEKSLAVWSELRQSGKSSGEDSAGLLQKIKNCEIAKSN